MLLSTWLRSSLVTRELRLKVQAKHRSLRARICSQRVTQMTAAAHALHPSADGAFIDIAVKVKGNAGGPLAGLTFGAKDLFDVAGFRTGNGNPVWLETHEEAAATAPAVQALLDAGASLEGKTAMDELAYSLNGENMHYGTPVNPVCPERVPGGSSSGSTVAVASGAVDIGLGSDTAGSVRVPASYCGVYGFRPTWGRVSLEGARALAPSYDTGGWVCATAQLLQRVGSVLLQPPQQGEIVPGKLSRWLVSKDAFALAQPETSMALYQALSADFNSVQGLLGPPVELEVGTVEGPLRQWMDVFRVTQAREVWDYYGPWVTKHKPQFGPGISDRFKMAAAISDDELQTALDGRQKIREHVWKMLGEDGFITVPSAPGPAPLLKTPPQELDVFRTQLISVTSIASLCQLPQVSIPITTVEGCPVGLGIIGPRNSDEALLQLALDLATVLKLP